MNMIEELKKVEGKKINEIGRAADMLWIGFGEKTEKIFPNGKTKQRHAYSLHLQCPWRIVDNSKVILGSYDMYITKCENDEYEYASGDDFNTIFDENAKLFNKDIFPLNVLKVQLDAIGNIKIEFQHNYYLEVFIHSSIEKEFWRFIETAEDEHIVHYDI